MARMAPNSSEYTVSRNYLDWLLEMPWSVSTQDALDVRQARRSWTRIILTWRR